MGAAVAVSCAVMCTDGSAQAQASTSRPPERRVIVMLKDQLAPVPLARSELAEREHAFAAVEGPLVRTMSAASATDLHTYHLIDAVSGTVTPVEETRLRHDPSVARVIPDQVIRLSSALPAPGHGAGHRAAAAVTAPQQACAPSGETELDPEALQTIRADSDDPNLATARSLGITGAGVRIGLVADNLDVNDPDFIRPDGEHVIYDDTDFTGKGTSVPTGGAEAFLDAAALAAQGNQAYDVSHDGAVPLNQPCPVRIEGVAPGAGVAILDAFGDDNEGFTSALLQAIDYGITVDHIQVLNESLVANTYPDDAPALDVIKQAQDAAVAAGVTVVAGSGDTGPTNTEGSPASDPSVLSVGASTTYRALIQSGFPARFPAIAGWVNDNVSEASASGFTLAGQTVDLVAPGEFNWSDCSTDVKQYANCYSDAGQPAPIVMQGITSQASPYAAGTAALVIQAYQEAHGGQAPTPAQVKQIIISSADDIGAPAQEQGAGRLDAYRAVLAAEAGASQEPAGALGATVLQSPTQLHVTDEPGSPEQLEETISNPSATATQTVSLSTRTLGPYTNLKRTQVDLEDATSPHILDAYGYENNYATVHFAVPAGEDRLRASVAFHSGTYPVFLTLVSPTGQLADFSDPQGPGNHGVAEVTEPAPGHWTAYISAEESSVGGTTGPVQFAAGVARDASFGTVSPSVVVLAPGGSQTVQLDVATPPVPGDTAGSIVLDATTPAETEPTQSTVPVTLRSLIPAGHQRFRTRLTGGVGRDPWNGQTSYYQLKVAAGLPELNATIRLLDGRHNPFTAVLVSPGGEALATTTNDHPSASAPGYVDETGGQLHVLQPQAGIWTLVIEFSPQVSGRFTAQPVRITTNDTAVDAAGTGGLPRSSSRTLVRGVPRTFDIHVRNRAEVPEAYFADARLRTDDELTLSAVNSATTKEPLTFNGPIPTYLVPTESTSVTATARTGGLTPIEFDMSPTLGVPGENTTTGDPDIESSAGKQTSASFSGDPLAPGLWSLTPVPVGPFGPQKIAAERVSTTMSVTTRAFDPSVSSPAGDLWQDTLNPRRLKHFAPIDAGAGKTVVIPVTITPHAKRGTIVHGTLYIDDASLLAFQVDPDYHGGEVMAIPYTYRVA
jgi:Subtilase family